MDIVQKGFFEMKFHNVYQSVHTEIFFFFFITFVRVQNSSGFLEEKIKTNLCASSSYYYCA